jgi:hypothetical protein
MWIARNGIVASSMINYIYLLNQYPGADITFSMFKLRSAYTGSCLRVRRSSDNTEQDIGFVNNYLDTASLLTFVGANNGFIVKWYDQSGNANNLGQTTASNQPQIVISGSLITKTGGKAFFKTNSTQYLSFVTPISNIGDFSWWMTYEKDSTANRINGYTNNTNYFWGDYNTTQRIDKDSSVIITATIPINTTKIISVVYKYAAASDKSLYSNGSLLGTKIYNWGGGTNNVANMTFFPTSNFGVNSTWFSELILWKTDQSSNRIGIESEIKNRTAIY